MRRFSAVVLFALAACGGSEGPTNPASASLAGSYTLRTVNGNHLPYTLQSGTNSLTITADVLTVADGGTWSESGSYQQTVNGQTSSQTFSDGGSWDRSGPTVTFTSTNSNTAAYGGSFTGSGFGLTDGTFAYVFTK